MNTSLAHWCNIIDFTTLETFYNLFEFESNTYYVLLWSLPIFSDCCSDCQSFLMENCSNEYLGWENSVDDIIIWCSSQKYPVIGAKWLEEQKHTAMYTFPCWLVSFQRVQNVSHLLLFETLSKLDKKSSQKQSSVYFQT